MAPTTYQAWESCRSPPTPGARLPALPQPVPRLTRRQAQAAEAPHGHLLRRPARRLGGGDDAGARKVTECGSGRTRAAKEGVGLWDVRVERAGRA